MQPSQETRVLAEFDGINWDLGLLRMRVVRGNVHTRILHGWGPGIGWGGEASAVGTTIFNNADGSGDVSSENEYINVMFWYLFLGKDTETQGQWPVIGETQLRRPPLRNFLSCCKL